MAHEHTDDCDDDCGEDEIEITINPREEDLQALGVDLEEFEAALLKTLDSYEDAIDVDNPDATGALEEAEISLGGKFSAFARSPISRSLAGSMDLATTMRMSPSDSRCPRSATRSEMSSRFAWNPGEVRV